MTDDIRKIACNYSAIPEDKRKQHAQTAGAVFESIETVEERNQGYAFKLPENAESIARAGEFIARERLCCPFFRFKLEIKPDSSEVWLELTGKNSVKDYIKDTVLSSWDFSED